MLNELEKNNDKKKKFNKDPEKKKKTEAEMVLKVNNKIKVSKLINK